MSEGIERGLPMVAPHPALADTAEWKLWRGYLNDRIVEADPA